MVYDFVGRKLVFVSDEKQSIADISNKLPTVSHSSVNESNGRTEAVGIHFILGYKHLFLLLSIKYCSAEITLLSNNMIIANTEV